jgi:hypothetical protein
VYFFYLRLHFFHFEEVPQHCRAGRPLRTARGDDARDHRASNGPTVEVYLNTPMQVPEAELRTELYVPIA